MSLASKRELAARVAPRYQEARRREKSAIFTEFVAATGDERKTAIRVLQGPIPVPRADSATTISPLWCGGPGSAGHRVDGG